jgi:hypothetical protein
MTVYNTRDGDVIKNSIMLKSKKDKEVVKLLVVQMEKFLKQNNPFILKRSP